MNKLLPSILVTLTFLSCLTTSFFAQAQTPMEVKHSRSSAGPTWALNLETLSTLSFAASKDRFYGLGGEYFVSPHFSVELSYSYSSIKDGTGSYQGSNALYKTNSVGDSTSEMELFAAGARWHFDPASESGLYLGLGFGNVRFRSSLDYDVSDLAETTRSAGVHSEEMTTTGFTTKIGYRYMILPNMSLNISGFALMPSKKLKQTLDLKLGQTKTNLGSYEYSGSQSGILGDIQFLF